MRVLAVVLVVAAAMSLSFAQTSPQAARIELKQGVDSYKQARYEEAVEHFRKAAALDPDLLNAHLYLATALAQQYIPGGDTPENVAFAEQAITEYKAVLDRDPQNINSIKGIASLYLQMKKFDDSRTYYLRATEADPQDPEAYYSVGVLDWTQSYQPRMEERSKLDLRPDAALIDKPACWPMREHNWDRVKDGIEMFGKALQLRPDYDDAMAYMNLMYRERADIQCGDRASYQADLNAADKWVDLTMAAKKAKSERPNASRPQPNSTQP